MAIQNLLYKREYQINNSIKIIIPTIGEIMENEENYYSLISALTSMPIDMMVQLDDAGIDFTTINEYDLFLLIFDSIKSMDTSLIFGDLDLTRFKMAINNQNGNVLLVDEENDIKIDRAIHGRIADTLRIIHH